MPITVVQTTLRKGELIGGRFKILRKLGSGGAGSVYHCQTANGAEAFAVKVLDNPADHKRFAREAKVMKAVNHPHVLAVVRTGKHEKTLPYIALEYAEGGSLRGQMEKKKSFPPEVAAWIVVQAVQGLRAAKTVHRDLKPENLLISLPEGARSIRFLPGDLERGAAIKVADFGLAKPVTMEDTSLTRSGQIMGTPQYMSPEQCRNTKHVGFRTDVYALGIILVELATGRVPFDANNVYDLMAMHCNDDPKLGRVPKPLRAIAERCLAKKPGERYGSLKALEKDLANVAGVAPSAGGGGGAMWFLVMLVILGGLAAAAWWFWPQITTWLETLDLGGPG
jgi:serine/threonine-protein kinase